MANHVLLAKGSIDADAVEFAEWNATNPARVRLSCVLASGELRFLEASDGALLLEEMAACAQARRQLRAKLSKAQTVLEPHAPLPGCSCVFCRDRVVPAPDPFLPAAR